LDVDYRAGRAHPLWKGRRVVAEGGVIDLVNKDAEESGGLAVRIWFEFGVDLDDECGGDGGEQTSLLPKSARVLQYLIRNSRISELYSDPHHTSS
jgi:hypothetical protein